MNKTDFHKFREMGYVYLDRFISVDGIEMIREETKLMRPSLVSQNGGNIRCWSPAIGKKYPILTSLFLNSQIKDFAQEALQRSIFGVMCDFNYLLGPTKLHSDAMDYSLAGLRFNIYLESIHKPENALKLYPGSHMSGQWDMFKSGVMSDGVARGAARGDVVVMNLRTWHEVELGEEVREFVSLFYYAIPKTFDEKSAVLSSAKRNRLATKKHLKRTESLYDVSFLDAISEEWHRELKAYTFI